MSVDVSKVNNFSVIVKEEKNLVTVKVNDSRPVISIKVSEIGIPGKTGDKGTKGDKGIPGDRGLKGDKGDNAENPNFTVVTGTPESEVTITGTYPNLELSIPKGDVGSGVASGGETNEVLVKKSATDYDTEWRILSLTDLSDGNTFEIIANNLRSYPVIETDFDPGVSLSKTYQTPNGNIVVTTNFEDGKPSSKVLSGSGLPSGVLTNKTYDFTGRTIPLVSYT